MSKTRQLTIDGETADRITVLNLQDYRAYFKKELAQWRRNPQTVDNPDGVWLHPDDVTGNIRRIEALNLIISDFIKTEDTIK